MEDWNTVETALTADGSEFVLARRGHDWVVRVDERVLMSNSVHDSEIELAERAIDNVLDPHAVLVGGLGLGYTLRAVLDCVADDAEVTVAELVPELVEWNRTHLKDLNAKPLDDPRCTIVSGDVFDTIKRSHATFDVILLDVDNGPRSLAQAKNQRLYTESGVRACYDALRPGGVVAVWSTGPNAKFERKLRRQFADVEVARVPARIGYRGQHVLFIAAR